MNDETQTVSFTLGEVNQILNALGDIPAKFSLDLVNFIRAKAQEQVGQEQDEESITE